MRLFERLRGFLGNEKGNVLVLAAAAMPLIIGSAGLAVDTIQLSLLKRHLQRAADSGALAGAYAKAQDQGFDIEEAVDKALTFNDAFPLSTAETEEPSTGTFANRSVRVRLTATRSLPFMSFFTSTAPVIEVEAMAALVYSGEYCMIALDESAATGITFGGNATVNMGCGIISNTSGAAAVGVNGNASSVTASPIAAVGGVPSSRVYQQPTLLLPYSLKQADPFADLPDPPSFPTCSPKMVDSTTPTPGCYQGLDVNGTKTLPPGTYYLKGDLKLNANSVLNAPGVTFVFTSDTPTITTSLPKIEIDGSATLNLTAPTSGTFEGVAMYYDRRTAAMSPGPKIEGNSTSSFEGAFYFPTQNVTFRGNSAMTSDCIQLVAFQLTFEGNTRINNECDDEDGGASAFDATWVRLVA